ncbi:MAG: hypothetical protein WCQ72_04005 [Eubacteriales bacterium]
MNFVLSRIIDYILGFLLQSLGCAINVYALNKRKIEAKSFAIMTILFSICTLIIRNITIINFGFHTILIIAAFVLIAITLFKFPIYSTALAMLLSTIMIMLCEVINYLIMYAVIGGETVSMIMSQQGKYVNPIYKSLLGVPTNIILVFISLIIYRITQQRAANRAAADAVSAEKPSDGAVSADDKSGGMPLSGSR